MKFSRILIILGIICVAGLLLFYGVKLQAQNKDGNIATKIDGKNINIENIKANLENLRQRSNRGSENRQQASGRGGQARSRNNNSDGNSFYQVIIDNSLFRPLGWRPPNKEPEYSFISTTVDTNGTKKSEAYVLEKRSNRLYNGNIGDEVGGAIIKEIKEKEIILDKDGETITLRLENLQFLSKGGSSRGSSRENRDESEDNKEANEDRNNNRDREAAAERNRREMAARASEMRRRFQSASSEERMRMIQQFRERGGRSRRGSR